MFELTSYLEWAGIHNPLTKVRIYFALKSCYNCFFSFYFFFLSPLCYTCCSVLRLFLFYYFFLFFFYRFISPQRSIHILRCWIFCAWQLNCRNWCTSKALVRMLPSDLIISTDGFIFKMTTFMSQLFKGWKFLPPPEKSVSQQRCTISSDLVIKPISGVLHPSEKKKKKTGLDATLQSREWRTCSLLTWYGGLRDKFSFSYHALKQIATFFVYPVEIYL